MENHQRYQTSPAQAGGRSRTGRIDLEKDLFNSCFRLLSTRPRSRKEILSHLQKYTSNQSLINQIINKLISMGYVDDKKFASWLIQSRSRTRPRGKRLLLQELKSKGIDAEEPVMINEAELAEKALEKKLSLWLKLSHRDFRIKATRFLYSRGFSWDVIEPVLKKAYNKGNVS
jgi:regulatory protein